jgi:hypothetical protein
MWLKGPAPRQRQPYDTQAFDATVLCYLTAVAAGSTRGTRMRQWLRKVSSPPGEKFDWQHLPEAIRALEAGKDIDYQGASGPIDIEPLDVTQPANPTAGFYDAYRYKDARLAIYGTVAVPGGRRGFRPIPIQYVSPRVPGVGPQPKLPGVGATGATGANGATGAKGANDGKGAGKKKKKKSG